MEILFTASSSPLSSLIRSITHEDVSHCAIRVGEFVVHSNLKGVIIEPYSLFNKKNKIKHRIYLATRPAEVHRMLAKHFHSPYDYGALLFLALRFLIPRLPKRNLWQDSGMFLCTEFVSRVVLQEDNNMLTPFELYTKLKDNVHNGILT